MEDTVGKVFTWTEIKTKAVPEAVDFMQVLHGLRDCLVSEPAIVGAVVCGSLARGDHDRRSDVDCVVVYDANEAEAAHRAMQALTRSANRHHVPLSFIQTDTRLARTRMHHFGPSFVEHVRSCMSRGSFVKGDPLGFLAPSVSREAGVEEYLRFKMHSLQSHWAAYMSTDEKARADFLQKVLEAPVHVARKTLSWRKPLKSDFKADVCLHYLQTMSPAAGGMLEELLRLDREYSHALEIQLRNPHESGYAAALAAIEEKVPRVLEFVRLNLEYLDQAAR